MTAAHDQGLQVTLTTSGVTVDDRWADILVSRTDLVAVSVDGPPAVHDGIRGQNSFERMRRGVELLKRAGAKVAILYGVSGPSWHHMPWVIRFAEEHGARLVQFHPIESAGRASDPGPQLVPSASSLMQAFVMSHVLQAVAGRGLRVHFDACVRDTFLASPDRYYAGDAPAPERLSHAVSALVLEPDGALVPASYGLDRQFAIANVREERLGVAASRWLDEIYPAFRGLARRVYSDVAARPDLVVFDWYAALVAASHACVSPHAMSPAAFRTV
jgi:sulfatase maturation enzyme AslB (radical SAM superfamily)